MKNLIKMIIKEELGLTYLKAVNNSLKNLYGNNSQTWGGVGERGSYKKGGVINLHTLNDLISKKENITDYEIDGGDWSILNYFNTNPKVRQYILDLFQKETGEDYGTLDGEEKLSNWIFDNRDRLFKDGPILKDLVDINFNSIYRGMSNEKKAYNTVKKLFQDNPDLEIGKTNLPGSSSDIKGVDFVVIDKKKNKTFSFQAKPFTSLQQTKSNKYVVTSYNILNLDKKPVDYFIFTTEGVVGIHVFKNIPGEYEILDNKTVVFNYPPIKSLEE